MSTITVCLHRGASTIGRLIRWQTRGDYSHASLVLPDGRHIEAREFKGVVMHERFTPVPGEQVDVFEIEATPEQVGDVVTWVLGELGRKYDYRAVFDFVTRGRPTRESETKWFCSELVFAALQRAGIELFRATEPWEVSPALLARSPLLKPSAQPLAA